MDTVQEKVASESFVNLEISKLETRLVKEIQRQTRWIIGAAIALAAAIELIP